MYEEKQVDITINNSFPRAIRWLTITIPIVNFFGIAVYCWIFFKGGFQAWMIPAYIIAIAALLNTALAWSLYSHFRVQSPRLSKLMFGAEVIGSLIIFIGSVHLILGAISGRLPLYQTRLLIDFGYAFIGLWRLLLNYHARLYKTWWRHLARFGLITGILMAMSLITIPEIPPETHFALHGHSLWTEFAQYLGELGWMLLYPIWLIWFGRIFEQES